MPAVSCTSINARCATLGADASVATSLVIEDAGKANANAMIGKCRRQLADRLVPWSMGFSKHTAVSPGGGLSLTEHGAYQRNVTVLLARGATGDRNGRVLPRVHVCRGRAPKPAAGSSGVCRGRIARMNAPGLGKNCSAAVSLTGMFFRPTRGDCATEGPLARQLGLPSPAGGGTRIAEHEQSLNHAGSSSPAPKGMRARR
jgi:hypothetical protein